MYARKFRATFRKSLRGTFRKSLRGGGERERERFCHEFWGGGDFVSTQNIRIRQYLFMCCVKCVFVYETCVRITNTAGNRACGKRKKGEMSKWRTIRFWKKNTTKTAAVRGDYGVTAVYPDLPKRARGEIVRKLLFGNSTRTNTRTRCITYK